MQVSVLGYANNLNRTGFSYSELLSAGGFDRIRSNSNGTSTSVWNSNSGSGVSINGINFGGSQSFGGISTSTGGGFNLNHAPNQKRSLYLQYFNGNVNAERLTFTDVNQYTGDTIINNNTRLRGNMITHGHNIGAGARLKPDSVTNILINANYLIGIQEEDRINKITGNSNKTGPLSEGDVVQNNDANTYWYRHSVSISRMSKMKKGRRFNTMHNLDINNRYNDYTSESDISYLYPLMYDSQYAQLRKERIPRTDAVTTFNYSEPIGKKFTIRIGGRYEYSKLNNGVSTYNRNGAGDKFEVLNTLLSSDFRRIGHRFFISPALEYKVKPDFTISPSLRFLDQHVTNKLVSSAILLKQKQFDVLPGVSVVYKKLSLNYNKDVILPGFNYLNPVTDISNPYFVTKGNPTLLPAKRDNFSPELFFQ
ncbi:MAG: outer membrane beta-barrel protein [Bacteroidota bacterium]